MGAEASMRMITSVRIARPIIDTPPSTADAIATTAVTATIVGKDPAAVAAQQRERQALEHARLRDDRHEERQPEDEQHRVEMNQIVEAGEGQQMRARPRPGAMLRDLGVPRRRRQPAEGRDDDEQHAVGQRVLVDLDT